jgi:hypothetical protein
MTPSGFEDTTVDELDFSNLSDDDLRKIASDDERTTAQEGAQAELNRREPDSDSEEEETETKPIPSMLPEDPMERAGALGLNTEGINLDPDFGQVQIQNYADAVEESGVHPPTGGPPSDAMTANEVVKQAEADKVARREAMEASAEGK